MGPWVGLPGRQAGQGGLLGAGQTFLCSGTWEGLSQGVLAPWELFLTGDYNIQGKPLAPWVSPRPLKGPEP